MPSQFLQEADSHLLIDEVIFCEQGAEARPGWQFGGGWGRGLRWAWENGLGKVQGKPEGRAVAIGALDANFAAHELDQFF